MDALSIVPENFLPILAKLDPPKGHSPDDIHPRLFKLLAHFVAAPLAHLFNITLSQRNVLEIGHCVSYIQKGLQSKSDELSPSQLNIGGMHDNGNYSQVFHVLSPQLDPGPILSITRVCPQAIMSTQLVSHGGAG